MDNEIAPDVTRPVDQDLATVPIGQWFKITPRGLRVVGDPPFDAFADLGEMLRTFERTMAFVVGDWINQLEDRFGEKSAQLVDATGWSLNTIRAYAWTARKVPPENRFIDAGLTYAHHQAVAALAQPEQRHWLTLALGNGDDIEPWSVTRLRAAISKGSDLQSRWWILVECKDEAEQGNVLKALELQGRTCKALTK
jgi:hypothetical protein